MLTLLVTFRIYSNSMASLLSGALISLSVFMIVGMIPSAVVVILYWRKHRGGRAIGSKALEKPLDTGGRQGVCVRP